MACDLGLKNHGDMSAAARAGRLEEEAVWREGGGHPAGRVRDSVLAARGLQEQRPGFKFRQLRTRGKSLCLLGALYVTDT